MNGIAVLAGRDMEEMAYGPAGVAPRTATWVKRNGSTGVLVAVGARCTPKGAGSSTGSPDQVGVDIDEFVEFDDGSRVSIRWDRGCAISLNGAGQLSEQELLEHLEGALLPDEGEVEDLGERRSWHEHALLLAEQGINATAQELKNLPYLTELSSDLRVQVQA